MRHILMRALYICFAQFLPKSSSFMGLGKILRAFCAKSFLCKFGKNVNIDRKAAISKSVEIGDNSGIGRSCELRGKVVIGDNVMMGPMCCFYTVNHMFSRTDIPMILQGSQPEKPIVIEDDVWIGGQVIILPGVTIHTGSIIGAGSVVSKDVPPYTIVAGNPAKVIRMRKEG